MSQVNIAANNYYQGVQNGDVTVNYAFNILRPSLDLNEGWRIRVVSSDPSVPAGPAAPAGFSAQSDITQVSLDWADNTEPGTDWLHGLPQHCDGQRISGDCYRDW